MGRFKDLSGKVFSRLTVIERAPTDGRRIKWLCRCSCGKQVIITGENLVSGHTKSCGCLKRDKQTTHGMSSTPEWNAWVNMRARCTDRTHPKYHRYGGRGISVCPEWVESFVNFFTDMGYRPSKEHSLDRINNNGNYNKSNCKWSTRKEQQQNMSTNRLFYAVNPIGRRFAATCQAEFARKYGLNASTIASILNKGECKTTKGGWRFYYA